MGIFKFSITYLKNHTPAIFSLLSSMFSLSSRSLSANMLLFLPFNKKLFQPIFHLIIPFLPPPKQKLLKRTVYIHFLHFSESLSHPHHVGLPPTTPLKLPFSRSGGDLHVTKLLVFTSNLSEAFGTVAHFILEVLSSLGFQETLFLYSS